MMSTTALRLLRLAGVLAAVFVVPVSGAVPAQQHRIAILAFDAGPEAKKSAAQFGITDDLGVDLSNLLLSKLVNDGKFIVIVRGPDNKSIIDEQNTANSNRNDPATAAKIGKILGVDEMVIGNVTQFGEQTKDKTTAVNKVIKKCPFCPSIHQQDSEVRVQILVRLVDTTTGQVIAAPVGKGEPPSNSKIDVPNSITTVSAKNSDFANSNIGEATLQAINSIASQLELANGSSAAAAPAPPPVPLSYSGVVADVSDKTLILTVGTKAGVKVGDVVTITRVVRKVYDPNNPAVVIKVISDPIGPATITQGDDSSSTATYQGTAVVKVSDAATKSP